jgi:copper(I)-binding protein
MIAATIDVRGGQMRFVQRVLRTFTLAVATLLASPFVHAEGKLSVFDAWIRSAPPGATMMAGYATLTNAGDVPIKVLTVQSDAFRQSSIHETVVERGVTKMRELPRVDLAPGATVEMKPGGAHLMLSEPRHPIVAGEKVQIVFLLADGTRLETYFDVVAPDATGNQDDADNPHG